MGPVGHPKAYHESAMIAHFHGIESEFQFDESQELCQAYFVFSRMTISGYSTSEEMYFLLFIRLI